MALVAFQNSTTLHCLCTFSKIDAHLFLPTLLIIGQLGNLIYFASSKIVEKPLEKKQKLGLYNLHY